MTSIWSITSTPADATQLLQVTATYGEDSLVLCTDESVAFMWFKIESNSRYRDDDVDIFFEPL
ncbi:hypothetical protein M407DRAFT_242183 [Tulasnella calospora MUT 4182]|uniref:Uncharacterized protein n=1 Tax=Tulasnella calospora MUT 4182 TaxID=1051891 RepID=A0A0C3M9N2_9AGAM|nr:hypothetical protein M407DRAFT_242183 [Tulasnella calospora MUT 4182]